MPKGVYIARVEALEGPYTYAEDNQGSRYRILTGGALGEPMRAVVARRVGSEWQEINGDYAEMVREAVLLGYGGAAPHASQQHRH
jgi:hypothetical protein